MEAIREQVVKLHLKNFRPCQIFNNLKQFGVSKRFIFRTLKRFKDTGNVHIQHKGGAKRTARTKEKIKCVRERIRRNPAVSGRKLSKQFQMSPASMNRLLRHDLECKPYKKQRVHGLTERQKQARVQRSRNLLVRHGDCEILFSDEKLFLLQDNHNQQNDRVYGKTLADIPRDKLAVERYQNVSKIMVWGAVSRKGKLPLLFIEPNVKINTEYYIEQVLKNHLLPHASTLYGNAPYCFQQDSAPAHKAKKTQEWCAENLPDFITSEEWPASSPDLNPLDFFVWGYMLQQIGPTKGLTLDRFKKRLVDIWDQIPQEIVRASCDGFTKRLRKVIKEKGERFELN